MGLSRKLGGAGPRAAADPESDAVPYKWSTQTYTMAELLSKFKLPCVVQCATDSCTVVWSDFQFDLRQPMLLYEKRTVQKLHAISVSVPKAMRGSGGGGGSAEALEEVGPPMAIPCDYDGWFSAAPKGEAKAKRHTRVEGVANSTARRFLVTTKLPAFTSSRSAEDGSLGSYVPHDVLPGEVLKRVCVLDPSPADPDCPAIVRLNGPCLECLDEKDEDVLIPLSRRAMLYEIAEVYPDEAERVFTAAQMVAAGNAKLPRVLKLAHGDPPLLAYAFTGMIRCYSIFTEETILAATLDDVTSICLELATDSCARFRLGLNEAAVKKTCEYVNAHHMCDTFGAKFLTGIKVSFSLQPELTELEDIDLSFYESQNSYSDMQEVEANSEFEITWGAVKKAKLLSSGPGLDPENGDSKETDNSDGDEDDAFLLGITETSSGDKAVNEGEYSDTNAVGAKGCEPSLPQQREFTEKEIADLMQRKGMIATSGSLARDQSENSLPSLDSLKENKVRDNPLYYYFQRQAQEQEDSPESVRKTSGGEGSDADPYSSDKKVPHTEQADNSIAEQLPDLITAPTEMNNAIEVSDEREKEALDTSLYEQVLCTPAREYSEDEAGGNESSSSSDSDRDSDILNEEEGTTDSFNKPCTSEESKTHFPIEANVVIKSMGKRATRSYPYMSRSEEARTDFRGSTFDTSSSDDINSDFEKLDGKLTGKGKQGLLLHTEGRPFESAVPGQDTLDTQNIKRTVMSTNTSRNKKSSKDSDHSDFIQGSSFKPLVAGPVKPTFTEVDDDPLESTMSELDKITSITPSAFMSDECTSGQVLHISEKSSITRYSKNDIETSSEPLPKETLSDSGKSHNKGMADLKALRVPNNRLECPQVSTRPTARQISTKKHADIMQEDDRFDSPKVSHHPHVHPHPTVEHISPGGSLHMGHWTTPVPLGGQMMEKNNDDNASRNLHSKTKVLNSVQNIERFHSTGANSNGTVTATAPSTGSEQGSLSALTGQISKLSKSSKENVNVVTQSNNNSSSNIKALQFVNVGYDLVEGKADSIMNTKDDKEHKSIDEIMCSSKSQTKPDSAIVLPQPDGAAETDSDEDFTTIEEHYVVSADSSKPLGANLKVLPVYHEDLHPENFV